MKVLVTGGAGFIGSHVADAFINRGDEVFILDNLCSGKLENVNDKATLVQGDITDTELVQELFRKHKFDIINHHAAQLDVRKSVADPIFDCTTNIIGTLSLLEAARETGSLKLFMFASTGGAIYGEQDYFHADEQHPTRPISPYGVTKRSVELYLHYYKEVYGMNYVAFRYTNVYGPRQNAHGEAGVVAIFINKLLSGETPVIHGTGKQTRDYVYVGDLVRAHMLAVEKLNGSKIYNVSTGIETDVNTIASILSKLITDGKIEAGHGLAKAGEQMRSVCSYKLIEQELGWHPEMSLQDGLRETVHSFQSAFA